MATISFDIAADKLTKITTAMKGLYPIPQVNNGTEEEPVMENEFTDGEWAKECIRTWVKNQVARYEQKTAIDAIKFSPDDELLS